MTEPLKIVALTGGVGFPSTTRTLTDDLLSAVAESATAAGVEVSLRTVEAREHAADVANATVLGLPSPALDEALQLVEGADLLIAASPVFRGSYAGIFKAFMDLVDPVAMRGKTVLLGATGGSSRHQLAIDQAMRPLFAYFGALIAPTAVYASADDFAVAGRAMPALTERIARAGDEALRLAVVTARAHAGA
ncbi:CE1759 family FMN reductase [Occultella kanbiaonis]|uniref:CE1759 family FMN reductase n=1 Tax=Occultella kanbiaonis TaxID=2675754 RepID=UPI0012BA36AB|nr:CE1759 family FMN reductase [Occultella kanbiaonis]